MSAENYGEGLQHGSELRRSVSAAAERIEEILLEAERAAEEIRRDATVEAEHYLAQRRTEANLFVEDQLKRLETELGRFRERLTAGDPVAPHQSRRPSTGHRELSPTPVLLTRLSLSR